MHSDATPGWRHVPGRRCGVTIKWRNVAVFAFSMVLALGAALGLGVPLPAAIVLYGLGVWPCVVIVKMGWIE